MPDYFDEVRNYLDITYRDSDTEDKLQGICKRAEAYLSRAAGSSLIFSADMTDQWLLQLLFDCIRYIWSGSLDEFAANFADDLFTLRANVHADNVGDSTDSEDGSTESSDESEDSGE